MFYDSYKLYFDCDSLFAKAYNTSEKFENLLQNKSIRFFVVDYSYKRYLRKLLNFFFSIFEDNCR